MFSFLSKAWAALSTTQKATWNAIAGSDAVAPFNAYVRIDQARWAHFQTPGKTYPVGNTGTAAVLGVKTVTGGVGQVTIVNPVTTVNQNWGILIFRNPTATFTTSFSNLIAAIVAETAASFTYVDTPLAPGTYWYDTRPFTTDGVMGAETGELSGVVT